MHRPTSNSFKVDHGVTPELGLIWSVPEKAWIGKPLADELVAFSEFGQPTRTLVTRFTDAAGNLRAVRTYVNEFWTAKQRQANSLHEISYRACFKPQLPRFFIERLTQPGDTVYDPFMGRGTTTLEAALLGRVPFGNDINPLSIVFARPRLDPPPLHEIQDRLRQIDFTNADECPEDLLVFYHPDTLREIAALKKYFLHRRNRPRRSAPSSAEATQPSSTTAVAIQADAAGMSLDRADDWLCMVALNRLTGHSKGFFSVYTMPPNQAISTKSQRKINQRRKQTPPRRDVAGIIWKKSRQLLGDCTFETRQTLARVGDRALLLTRPADATWQVPDASVSLVVTSPPFLNVVDYATDNWLRCWFLDIDPKSVTLTVPRKLEAWQEAMTKVFRELFRVLKPGGHVAFEVGEVHGGKTKLEEAVLPCGAQAGLEPVLVLINDQKFTKTANCWGVDNNFKGTNTNRIVVLRKP